MNDLLDEFDDWELRDDAEDCASSSTRKGKEPAVEPESETEDEGEWEAAPSAAAPPSPTKSSEAGDLTCAICLGDIKLEEMAMVKGCDHIYCGPCILHWALHKENPWCPQCKQPFNYLLTYRGLDGELHDFPVEESVVLLKRARWFEDAMRASERTSSLLDDSRTADDTAWHEYADEFDLAEDEAIEAFYFSSAAGRARVLVGNRRFGEGGYIATGRRQARPVPPSKGKGGKSSKGKPPRASPAPAAQSQADGSSGSGHPSTSTSAGPSSSAAVPSASVAIRTPNANGGRKGRVFSSSPLLSSPHLSVDLYQGSASPSPGGSGSLVYGSSPSGSGRRAKRNARRAAASGMPTPQVGFDTVDNAE